MGGTLELIALQPKFCNQVFFGPLCLKMLMLLLLLVIDVNILGIHLNEMKCHCRIS